MDINNTAPLISIITPSFNSKKYIESSILSVIYQDYPHIEHIIVDGASTDGTKEVVEGLMKRFPGRIRLISELDRGAGDAWNKGIKIAQGDILGWLGADDEYLPGAVSSIIDLWKTNPDVGIIYGGIHLIDSSGGIIRSITPRKFSLSRLINRYQMIPTQAAFYPKKVVDAVGRFDDLGNDLDFFIKIAKRFPVVRLDKIIARFRVHPQSYTMGSNRHEIKKRMNIWAQTSLAHGGFYFSSYRLRYYLFLIKDFILNVLRK